MYSMPLRFHASSSRWFRITWSVVSHCTACAPTWSVMVDKNSVGGSRFGYGSVATCQDYCIRMPSCIAIDFNFNDSSCWLHTNPADLNPSNVYDQPDTNQYRIDRSCAATTTTTTTTTPRPGSFLLSYSSRIRDLPPLLSRIIGNMISDQNHAVWNWFQNNLKNLTVWFKLNSILFRDFKSK